MDYVVRSGIPEDLLVAFGSERRQDGSILEMRGFTRLTPEVADRLAEVPAAHFAVDVWLVPVPPV